MITLKNKKSSTVYISHNNTLKKYCKRYCVTLILLFIILSAIDINKNMYFPRYDSGGYITAALSLAHYHTYQDISVPKIFPGSGWRFPSEFYQKLGYDITKPDYPPFRLYPPVLSLCLAPIVTAFGRNFIAMQVLICIFALGCLWGVWLCFKGLMAEKYLVAIVSLLMFSLFYNYSQRIQAEIPYLFCSLLTLYFLGRYFHQKSILNIELLATLFLMNISIYIRPIGITLFFTIVFLSLVQIRQNLSKSLIVLILSVVFVAVPFYLYIEVYTTPRTFSWQSSVLRKDGWNTEEGYNKLFSLDTIKRMVLHGGAALMHGSRSLLGPGYRLRYSPFYFPIMLIMVCIFLTGFFSCFSIMIRPSNPMNHLISYFLAYLAFYAFLPWPADRFIIPILPFYIYFFIIGIEKISAIILKMVRLPALKNGNQPNWSNIVLGICLVGIVFYNLCHIATDTHSQDLWTINGNPSYHVSRWIMKNTKPNDIILVFDNFAQFAFTDRKCFSFHPGEWKNTHTEKYIKAKGQLDYLILSDQEDENIKAMNLLQKYQKILIPIKNTQGVQAFKIINMYKYEKKDKNKRII